MDAGPPGDAQTALGALKIITGATSDGLGLMEEATIAAVNGELSPFVTGVTYCAMIAACRDLTDYTRASEWTEATERWCERQSVSGFPGICRVHRAEVDGPRRLLGAGRGGAAPGDHRAGRLQRRAADGRRVLRAR